MSDPTKLAVVQWLLLGIQVATLIALVIYVWKTWYIASATEKAAQASAASVEEMRAARREASAPRVAVYFFTPRAVLAEIVIENFGEVTARDVFLTFDPPLQSSSGPNATEFFTTPKTLPPRARVAHAFDTWPEYMGKKLPLRYDVTITYTDQSGTRQFREEQVVDARGFQHQFTWTTKGVHDLVTAFEDFSRRFESGLSTLKSRQEVRDATELLEPPDTGLSRIIPQLLATWELWQCAEKAERVIAWPTPFLREIRRRSAMAVQAGAAEHATAARRDALAALFIAAYNHDLDVMGDTSEAWGRLAASVEAVQQAFG